MCKMYCLHDVLLFLKKMKFNNYQNIVLRVNNEGVKGKKVQICNVLWELLGRRFRTQEYHDGPVALTWVSWIKAFFVR